MESTITNCATIQVVVYNNRAGVAHDSLCAVPVEGGFPLCTIMRRTLQLVPRTGPYELRAQQNTEVHAEFMTGHFVVQKSRRKFSLMFKDQAHEQSNKILQTKGGAAGLYENHEALNICCSC